MTPRQGHHKIVLDNYKPVYQAMIKHMQEKYPDQIAAHQSAVKDPKGFSKDMGLLLQGSRMMHYLAHQSGALDQAKAQENRQKQLNGNEDYVKIYHDAMGIKQNNEKV